MKAGLVPQCQHPYTHNTWTPKYTYFSFYIAMVFQSSGPISFTKATLSYPVYSVDFDPYNRGYVVVAGGGGEGRSGVGNKIVRCCRLIGEN